MVQLCLEGRETAGSPRRTRILVVEDEAIQAKVLCRVLQRAGYEVEMAASVAAAEAFLETSRFDLLVSDINLPDGTGLELMRWAVKRIGIRGIAVSGYCSQRDVQESRAAGFAEHIPKPCDLQALLTTIGRIST